MTLSSKLAQRAFKMLAVAGVGAVVWVLLNWEDVDAEWQEIEDLWEGP